MKTLEEKGHRASGKDRLMLEMRQDPAGKGRTHSECVVDGEGPCGMAWGGVRGISWEQG